jgi:YgiT-type zinc finger domain-containing protein
LNTQASENSPMACIECGEKTAPAVINVTMWTDNGLIVVENVPAYVCHECEEQFYDDEIGAKILELANKGFPKDKMIREITVPVYSIDDDVTEAVDEAAKGREARNA